MSNTKFFIFIVIITTIGQLAAEVYIPSLPFISNDFKVDNNLVQLSISGFLGGMAIPAIFFGFASDYVGRRKILLISTSISLIGSIICFVAPSIYWLISGRIIQGIGFSGVGSIGRATLRDKFSGQALAKYMAYLGVATSIAIDIAPFLGGILQQFFSWRIIFAMLLIYNIYTTYLCYNYKNITEPSKEQMRLKYLLKICKHLLFKDTTFIKYNIISTINYALFMAFLAVTSFVYQERIGLSPAQFGGITLFLTTLYMAGCFINGKLLDKIDMHKLLQTGIMIVISSGIAFMIIELYGYVNFWSYTISVCLLYFGSGFIFANSSALAFMNIHRNIGTASALYSTLQIMSGAILIAFISIFNPQHIFVIGATICVLTAISYIILYWKK